MTNARTVEPLSKSRDAVLDKLVKRELTRTVVAALGELRGAQLVIAWLTWIEPLETREIADLLGVREERVWTYRNKALVRLRRLLRPRLAEWR